MPITIRETAPNRNPRYLRDTIAIAVWVYALVKVFVFDVDTYFFNLIVPGSQWILDLRIVAIAGVLALLWLFLGHKRFFQFTGYIVAYPLVVLFWKVPTYLLRRWAALVFLLPDAYSTALSFRSTFVLYTFAVVSAVLISLGKLLLVLVPAMIYLSVFLAIVIFRSFRRAHSPSVFSQLASIIRNVHPKIRKGEYDDPPIPAGASERATGGQDQDVSSTSQIPQLYMLHVCADFIAVKVAAAARDRKYNTLLSFSLLNVVVLAVIVFALLNWGLYKLNPLSFSGAEGKGFFHFVAFSLGQLATANLTTIQPVSAAATAFAAAEVFSSFLILVIGAFSILTAARDAYREDFQDFADALHETAAAIDQRIAAKYSLTFDELEVRIALGSAATVNYLRRIRGLSELSLPDKR